jgi:23S rRNA (cytidine1920-2'-O)/16S rRNA (cytidine1409-2'-O)-methyltransferase
VTPATTRAEHAQPRRQRLDLRLVGEGMAESREKAQALVMAGRVRVDGQPATKPGAQVASGAAIEVDPGPEHVGRGAQKLAGALDGFGIVCDGRVALDVGASTGGFTEILIGRGAERVYAVDVGRGQLHARIRNDPRVVVLERTNARRLSREQVPEPCSLATMDVSFISVLKILPALRSVLTPDADVVVLVKPQFELSRRDVSRGGVVREPEAHARALRGVAESVRVERGYGVLNACASPIAGTRGNREFFLHLRPETECGLTGEALCRRLDEALA